MTWLLYTFLTVVAWGVYGVLLHTGQVSMDDSANGRWKAFLIVGVAYFLTAVLAPLAILLAKGAAWDMPGKGIAWSLAAGIAGAVGAFGVLLAFGAQGTPPAVMSIVFAGAPIVNAAIAMAVHPPAGGLGSIRWPFFLGIVLAAVGGYLVSVYRPLPGPNPDKLHHSESRPPNDAAR
ncbi:MAG TPA: hypothetical protein VI643_03435 [Planctomycetota bacterium]|nr:hypothetical protein [Planctomycetota bacterium]